jgi:hypothetical protein
MSGPLIPVGCLVLAIVLGIRLAIRNHKELQRTREQRVAARREYKKVKNQKMKVFFGIKDVE